MIGGAAAVLKYAKPLAVLQALDDKTAAALTKNPTDPAALPTALKEVAASEGASPTLANQVEAIAKSRSNCAARMPRPDRTSSSPARHRASTAGSPPICS